MKKFLQLFLLTLFLVNPAYAEEDDGSESWMSSTITGLLNFLSGCIEVPKFPGIKHSLKDLNLGQPGKWVSTKTYVQANKLLKIQWDLNNIETTPEKYLVLFRIDPRFSKPQVFIQRYDYAQAKYISDFYQEDNGDLLKFQHDPELFFLLRVLSYIKYFSFASRPKIHVKKNDVINITLDGVNKYFAANSEMHTEFTREPSNPAIIYTESAGLDNEIIFTDIPAWCNVSETKTNMAGSQNICDPTDAERPKWCTETSNCKDGTYRSTIDIWDNLVGSPINLPFDTVKSSLPPCPEGRNSSDNTPLCKYDKGRGMELKVGSKIIKPTNESFVSSPFTGKDFFYYKSDAEGDLDFTTSWRISGMFVAGISPNMESWFLFPYYESFTSYLSSISSEAAMNFMHFGRYGMEVEIGSSESNFTNSDLSDIKLEYIIMEDGAPSDSDIGTEIDMNYKTNANASGYLWLRVANNSAGVGGSIKVKTANYSGSTWFSDIVYGKLIQPLREIFNDITKRIYTKFITNPTMQNIARGMMTVYVIIYGLSYLAGATQLTVTDLVVRILKMAVIIALFSPTSWNFFNDNMFRIFIEGSDYLFSNVVGVTSQVGNIFGFIDPIFDKYTNGTVWGLLFIQLLSIHNGLCFFAIMTIYSILVYFRAVLEVIISYCLAFLGLAIMVSLAPFFITFLLFEQTKSMFTNWISTMFSYMMQPTILLIFFLLIDQMMSEHILNTIVRACWGILIPIEIGLDLSFMGIPPIIPPFTLPFFPGIPFYVSQVKEVDSLGDLVNGHGTFITLATSTLLFYAYCKMSYGLVEYVTVVVQNLTNVVAARQDGKLQQDPRKNNPVHDIKSDMGKAASPITNRVRGVGGFAKEKIIDQKITHREKSTEHGGYNAETSFKVNGNAEGKSETENKAGLTASKVPPKPLPQPPGLKLDTAAERGGVKAPPRPLSKAPEAPPVKDDGKAPPRPLSKAPETAPGKVDGKAPPRPSINVPGSAPEATPDKTEGKVAPKPLPKPPGAGSTTARTVLPSAPTSDVKDLGAMSRPQPSTQNDAVKPDGPVKSFISAAKAAVSDPSLITAMDQNKGKDLSSKNKGNEGGKKGVEGSVEQSGGDNKNTKSEIKRNDVGEANRTNETKTNKGQGEDLGNSRGDKKSEVNVNKPVSKESEELKPQGNQQANIDYNKGGKEGRDNSLSKAPDSTLKPNDPSSPEADKKTSTRHNTITKGKLDD